MTVFRTGRESDNARPTKTRKQKRVSSSRSTEHRPCRAALSINPADSTKTGFADLPAELRNQIYELALAGDSLKPVHILVGAKLIGCERALGLLGACKAVRREALPFFYEQNTFRIDCIKLGSDKTSTECLEKAWLPSSAHYRCTPPAHDFLDIANRTQKLKMIRCLSFGFYKQNFDLSSFTPYLRTSHTAELVLTVNLLLKKPFYSLSVDWKSTQSREVEKIERVYSVAKELLDTTFTADRGVTKLSKRLVQEIAYCVFQARGSMMD